MKILVENIPYNCSKCYIADKQTKVCRLTGEYTSYGHRGKDCPLVDAYMGIESCIKHLKMLGKL